MFRWLAIVLILCIGTFFIMRLALSEKGFLLSDQPTEEADGPGKPGSADAVAQDQHEEIKDTNRLNSLHQLVIYDCRTQCDQKQDVPSEADGVLRIIGIPLTKAEMDATSPEQKERLFREGKWIRGAQGFLMAEEPNPERFRPDEVFKFPDSPEKRYRLTTKGERLTPNMVRVGMIESTFRRLEVGMHVEKDQLLALVDPKLALDDLEVKVAKFEASDAERRAAEKTRDEAKKRLDGINATVRAVPASVSQDEQRAAVLTWQRYIEEEVAKRAAMRQADRELNAALTQLRMHEVKADISGVIKVIYKNRGDAVKKLDPVLQIQNTELLRVEGMVEVQETQGLKDGMTVSVEPTLPAQPRLILRGHTGEVNCVAVTKGPQARVVSGSSDRSLRIWDSVTGQELWTVENRSPVRSVACTGPQALDRNLILAGFADGVSRIYNLDEMKQGSVMLDHNHQGVVSSVAFSPDGKLCLTAGEDRTIKVWKVDMEDGRPTVKLLHRVTAAHPANVTYVHFIPTETQTKVEFLSAGKDFSLTIWTMEGEKAPVTTLKFDQRSGDVAVLGTDGKHVLFDQESELRLRSLSDRTQIDGRLRNPPGSANFTTMALFAPDGKTILTNCASENRLQLWRTPPSKGRGSELRQLVWTTGTTNCGAFAPKDRFIVTGTQDQCVLIWEMPSDEEIERRLEGKISWIERMIEGGSSRQVRLWANLEKPPDWVVPGSTATMVITPSTAGK
jgi:WD40 repeat protein